MNSAVMYQWTYRTHGEAGALDVLRMARSGWGKGGASRVAILVQFFGHHLLSLFSSDCPGFGLGFILFVRALIVVILVYIIDNHPISDICVIRGMHAGILLSSSQVQCIIFVTTIIRTRKVTGGWMLPTT